MTTIIKKNGLHANWPEHVFLKTILNNPGIDIDGILEEAAATREEARRYLRQLLKSGDIEIDTHKGYRIKN